MTIYVAPAPYVALPARLAVFLSGRGSNFVALADACERDELPARIVAVVSDKVDAQGLSIAVGRGLPTFPIPPAVLSRADHEARLQEVLEAERVDVVCLAGYMRLLSPWFVERWPRRILNVHPALLPAFPGLRAQAQALRYGVRVSGATVHFVDAGVDTGPILEQEAVRVEPGDDEGTLSDRILAAEHRIYPLVVRRILEGGWTLDGRSIRFPPPKNPTLVGLPP